MTDDPHTALRRLLSAADLGELAALCARHRVRLLVAFGSAVDENAQPRDLDIAVAFERDATPDLVGVIDGLMRLAGTEKIDLMHLDSAGPVARERALVGTTPLYESRRGNFTRAQMAAISERMETAVMRRLDLELMSQ